MLAHLSQIIRGFGSISPIPLSLPSPYFNPLITLVGTGAKFSRCSIVLMSYFHCVIVMDEDCHKIIYLFQNIIILYEEHQIKEGATVKSKDV